MPGTALSPRGSPDEAGFGLLGIVISLLVVALLSLGALKALAGGSGAGPASQTLSPTVDRAYDVQAQSSLSTALQNVRDGAISDGGLTAADLAQFGVTTGPSTSATMVSGAVAPAATSGADSPLGFGGVTLAAASSTGTCWYVWFSTSATWFGFEPDATSCTATSMTTAPTPGAGSPGTVGWQQGSFPATG